MANNGLFYTDDGYAAMMGWYDRTLRHLAVEHDSIMIGTRHGHTHVVAFGKEDGLPVLLLHDFNGNALDWQSQFAALAASGARVYAPDIPGNSGKSAPTRLAWQGGAYGAWLSDVFAELGLQRAAVIAARGGAHIALRMAACAPERVTGLALLNPAGLLPLRFPHNVAAQPLFVSLTGQMRRERIKTPDDALAYGHGAVPVNIRVSCVDAAERGFLLLKHFRAQGMPGALADDDLRRCHTPTWVLAGESEPYWNAEALIERARAVLPRVIRAEVLAGDLLCDQSDALNTYLVDFLCSPQPEMQPA
jgi:pimeloyl-ACP methyl ester carboxylesterase